jgi:hypothetical protein
MSETPPPANGGTTSYRLAQVEKKVDSLETELDAVEQRLTQKIEKTGAALGGKFDRLALLFLSGTITAAVAVIVFALTLASGPP